jgi:hypothetical protein
MSHVVALAEAVPGDVLAALAGIGSMLAHAGISFVTGLVHGVKSMAAAA